VGRVQTAPVYDVALSFAGEDRSYVAQVAETLRDSGVRVFYDDFETVALWGKDLYAHLDWVYRKAARYCVVFISEHYASKLWTNHERRSAQARAFEENREYVLPARFDDTDTEGIIPTTGYVDLRGMDPLSLAEMIREKLGPRRVAETFPPHPDRLWEELEIPAEDVDERDRVRDIAYSFYRSLSRMTQEERIAVCGVLGFGCPGELPKGVHISLDLLARMTRLPKVQLLELLSAVRSLNVKVTKRESVHEMAEHDLHADDIDLFLSYWAPAGNEAGDSTAIAYEATHVAVDHFCEDHGLELLVRLDFGNLSTELLGPRAVEA
jgi:hypothetical protein